jgi:hypothetical protein
MVSWYIVTPTLHRFAALNFCISTMPIPKDSDPVNKDVQNATRAKMAKVSPSERGRTAFTMGLDRVNGLASVTIGLAQKQEPLALQRQKECNQEAGITWSFSKAGPTVMVLTEKKKKRYTTMFGKRVRRNQ